MAPRNLRAIAVWLLAVACSGEQGEPPKSGGELTDGDGATPAKCVHVTTDAVMRRDTDVLPVGACAPDASEPVCKLVVRPSCPCLSVQVPRTYYDCVCNGGMWTCTLTAQDAGMCVPALCETDGGDAS